MRLGTRILLLTLAITIGLAGTVIVVVTRQITAHETERSRVAIQQAVSAYFHQLRLHHEQIVPMVRLLMEDPGIRSLFESVEFGEDDDRRFAIAQLCDEIFGRLIQTELTICEKIEPAMHVLLNEYGDVLLASAAPDAPVSAADISTLSIQWPVKETLETDRLVRTHLWVGERLFLAFGVPLRQDTSVPPSHAYFVGYRLDDEWVQNVLGRSPLQDLAQLTVCFVVDRTLIASRGGRVNDAWVRAVLAARRRDAEASGRDQIEFTAAGERFLGEASDFQPSNRTRGTFVVASSLDQALAPLRRLQWTIALITVILLVVAIVLCHGVARLISEPVQRLVEGTQRIARGQFDVEIDTGRRDELGTLAASFNQMAAGLGQRDLIKDTFGKFVDPSVVENFLANPQDLHLGGEQRVQTVLFSDLAGFTALSEKLTPQDQVRLLNQYLGGAADVVADCRGIVDKFIGDAVVAFWGPPLTDDHAARACGAALRFVEVTAQMAPACEELGCAPLNVRVGIATGEVLVGNIGSKSKYNYTIMGDVANLGSRLEGVNKLYRTKILATAATANAAGDAFVFRQVDTVRVVGRREPVVLHQLLGHREGAGGDLVKWRDAYSGALRTYQSRAWPTARAAFEDVSKQWPQDETAQLMALRCIAFTQTNPGDQWDGVFLLDSK